MIDISPEQKKEQSAGIEEMLLNYLTKMKAGRLKCLPQLSRLDLLVTATGSLLGIGLITLLAHLYRLPLLIPSFGASAVLLYGACHVPMAQLRNVIGGHVVSALTGVAVYHLLGCSWWSITIGVTLAIVVMSVTHTLHPPGGATAFMAVSTGQGLWFVFMPVATGVLCLVLIAVLVNNVSPERKYPQYWY
ncbi:HPP family protein [Desulfurispora thermophila]|uniref:HPP family protein n=1 Tax=Desulfurispora thermophila TaxID=265470 RepID=UPI000381B66B|nr:HPP family protein [Desulfurispora thermophila]